MNRTQFRWYGRFVSQHVRAAAVEGLRDAAEHLLEYANRTVPLEEGTLMRSGQADVDPETLAATVSYDTPYAVVQHERLDFKHDPGRRAKWLELSLNEREEAIQQYIARKIRESLKG